MAKDPAVLFYTSDFLTGTMTMTNEQVGKYIRLLCLQHQQKELHENDMINICGSYDKKVFDKFTFEDGVYYNKRMREEHQKRSAYSLSRSQNRLNGIENKKDKPKRKRKSYDNHMENENIDTIFNYKEFISIFNSITKRDYRGDKDSRSNFGLRIKEGYTKEQLTKAITSASKDKYLVDGNWLTPEYITRSKILEKWSNAVIQTQQDQQHQQQINKPNSPLHQGLMGN